MIMGNHRKNKNIKNELAYFYAVVKNMDLNDSIKQSKINKHEILFEESIYGYFSNLNNTGKQLCEINSLKWIELIENDNLRNAICGLNKEEKMLLNYVFYERRTQSELSKVYNIAQQNVGKRISKLLKKNKDTFV